ncbi:ArsR/SmtB family transcription factor [Fictibacillus sp. WQ 8-8]|uniref:ArsR/SmtB family transcription factor n=1 Tax=Fictibacillus sp. WQ 8-8 TaxID=2938788 RepID=UPI0035C787CF
MPTRTVPLEKMVQTLKLLGDKTRLTIVAILKHRDCCVCELNEVFAMSQPSISQHLRKLKDSGLIKEERRGRWMYYSLILQSEIYPLIDDLLAHVPDQTENMRKIEESKVALHCDC